MTNPVNTFALRFDSFRDFVDTYSHRLAGDSLFLATEEPSPVGSTVEFSLSLSDDFRLLQGTGEVVWTIAGESPGMAVRIAEVDAPSQRLLSRLVENHREKGGSAFSLDPPPGAVTLALEADAPMDETSPPDTPAAAVPATGAGFSEPSIDLTESIDLSSTVPVGNALGMPFEPPPESPPNPFEAQPFEPNEVSEASEAPVPAFAGPEPPDVEEPDGDDAELLSVPELTTPEIEEAPEEAPEEEPVETPSPDLFASDSDDPLGGFVRPEESPFEAGVPVAPPVEMPDPQPSATWLQEDEAEVTRPGRPWFKIALVLAVLAAALFAVGVYMGDFVSGGPGGEEPEPTAAASESPAAPASGQAQEPAVVLADNDDEPGASATSGEPGATGQPTGGDSAPTPAQPAGAGPPPTASTPEGATLTGIERLTWRETPEGTVLVLQGDGRIDPSAFDVLRVSSGAPRAVIKIRGVTRPYPTPTTAVNTAQVRQVRSGFHVLPEGSEVHFVADLTGRDVEIAVASVEGRRLRVRFSDG